MFFDFLFWILLLAVLFWAFGNFRRRKHHDRDLS